MADSLFQYVSMLLPLWSDFSDCSTLNSTITLDGDVLIDPTQYKFYGGSAYFDGVGDRINGPVVELLSASFCYESWVRLPSSGLYQTFATTRLNTPASELWFGVETGTTTPTLYTNELVATSSTSLTPGAWHHVALTRSGTTFTIYVDGVASGSGTSSVSFISRVLRIGMTADANPFQFTGHMQDARLTVGSSRYTTDFTPPAKLAGTIAGTVRDAAHALCQRTVHVCAKDTPWCVRVLTSDLTTGSYSVMFADVECYAVAFDDASGTAYNAIVYSALTTV